MCLFMNPMRIFVENEPRKILIPILNPILELSQRSFSPCQVWTRAPQTNFPVFLVTRYESMNFRAMKFRFSCGAMSMSDLKFRHPDRIFPGTLRTCGRILSRNYSKFLRISIVLGVRVIQVSNISVIMLFKRDQRFLEKFQKKKIL